jgi:hypothetical protein
VCQLELLLLLLLLLADMRVCSDLVKHYCYFWVYKMVG